MRLKFFSKGLDGRNITVSAEKDGVTAGPLTAPRWGLPDAPNGGVVRILTDRTTLQAAPDSVRFTVDLSSATFDTTETFSAATGKTHTNLYDPRLHDLIFLWDMGDGGTWSAPVNVLASWKSKRYAKGPFVAHCYTQPGSYTVKLTVIEPSSGKVAKAPDLTVNVADPGAIYFGSDTICINPTGDSDFTEAPSGAQQVNADQLKTADALWTSNQGGNPKRWLFKRGGTFDVAVKLTNLEADGYYFGAYGTGARPILTNNNTSNSGRFFNIDGTYSSTGAASDLRIVGIDARGGYDPSVKTVSGASGDPVANRFISSADILDLVISDCHVSGCRSVNFSFNHEDVDNGTDQHIHLDDTYVTDFGGQYVVITEQSIGPKSSFAATGLAIVQNVDASSDDTLLRAPLRTNGFQYTHGRGCDLFHTGEVGQPCWKVEERPTKISGVWEDGHIVNIHSCSMEGGFPAPIRINGNMGIYDRGNIQNAIIDGNILLANYQSEAAIAVYGQGVTIRNNLGVKLAADTSGVGNRLLAFVNLQHEGIAMSAADGAPIDIYNNTMLITSTSAQQSDFISPFTRNNAGTTHEFNDVTVENNLLHMPALDTPEVPYAPVTTGILFAPRCKGRRPSSTFVLDEDYASVGDVLDTRPAVGSLALGAALIDPMSYLDITLTPRPAFPSVGAWEM